MFQTKKRYQLVINLAAVQMFCLGWGIYFFSTWMTGSIRETVHEQVLADNIQVARQMTTLIKEMQLGDVRHNLDDWNRMQSVIQEVQLPNEGYVCLVDQGDGNLICHPALKSPPNYLVNTKPMMAAKAKMTKKMMPSAFSDDDRPKVSGGVIGEGDTLQVVAAAEIPVLEAKLLVHQKGSGIDRAVSNVTAPILPIGLTIALCLVASTTIAMTYVIKQYDNRLGRINEKLEVRVEQRTRSLRRTRDAVIFGLAKLAESRDTDTGEHLERIRTYVNILVKQLVDHGIEVDSKTVRDIGLASSLHDIGKVGIADRVLLKPGKLDAEERAEMQKHALLGGDCLQAIGVRLGEDDFLQLSKEIAYAHHEKWDGTGYPNGLAGEMIPLSARIVALADVYDALRSRRPYKEPMPHERARSILLRGSGEHFDPVVIEAFLACEREFEAISDQSASASHCEHAEAVAMI